MSRLCIDVGDLFDHAGLFRRPSGIQRVIFELSRALAAGTPDDGSLCFLRRGAGDDFLPVDWADIAALFAGLTDDDAPPAPADPSPFAHALRLQIEAWQALVAIPRQFRAARPTKTPSPGIPMIRPGDTLLVAGAGWTDSGHLARVSKARRNGARVALLVYDIVPLRRPEWFDPTNTLRFRTWLDGMLAMADRTLAISQATAKDVATHRLTLGLSPVGIDVIRLGDGFSQPSPPPVSSTPHPLPGPYALYVSTIEIRKNHALLVEVWRRLLQRMPSSDVPFLVFAGREGALSADLMHALRATDDLGGRVILRHASSDADIAALYRFCQFTLFPSLYEGWGLPVAESLVFGKPCLASNASSIPEAGGTLARYFDPLDTAGTTRTVEALLRDPAGLQAWERDITRHFRPAEWSDTAAAVRAALA